MWFYSEKCLNKMALWGSMLIVSVISSSNVFILQIKKKIFFNCRPSNNLRAESQARVLIFLYIITNETGSAGQFRHWVMPVQPVAFRLHTLLQLPNTHGLQIIPSVTSVQPDCLWWVCTLVADWILVNRALRGWSCTESMGALPWTPVGVGLSL